MLTNSLTIVEGGLLPALHDIVTPNTPLNDELVSLTMSSIMDEIQTLYPASTFRMVERGIFVTKLSDEVIAFFCGIYRADPNNFNLILEDKKVTLTVSKGSAYPELNVWLILQKIINQYRMLTEALMHVDDSEFAIRQMLAS